MGRKQCRHHTGAHREFTRIYRKMTQVSRSIDKAWAEAHKVCGLTDERGRWWDPLVILKVSWELK